jgi:hypothetical protein
MTTPSQPPRPPFVVDARICQMIAGAVAEIDLAQIAMLRRLTPAERFAQMLSLLRFTETAAADRLRLRAPNLSEEAAFMIVRSGQMLHWLTEQRKQQKQRE